MNENANNDSPPDDAASGKAAPSRERDNDARDTTPVSSRNLVAWIALALAAIALARVGFQSFVGSGEDSASAMQAARIEELTESLHSIRRTTDANESRIGELVANAAAHNQRFQAIEDQFAERLQRLEMLQARLAALDTAMAELRGISSGLRDSWLLAEAEYYMQIANAQLQLADNPKLAALALQLADEKVSQLANPSLTDVRRALADELRALDSMESPDIEGISLMLSSLASVVESLPLNTDVDTAAEAAVPVDPELTGMDRVFASLRKTASEIVSVRRSDETVRPLLAPEAQYFLRTNLALQFQAARIALLRGEQALFDQFLDEASGWLNRYYDAGSAPVRSALQTISEMRQSVSPVARPDLSESLRLLREYRVLSATDSQPDPASAPAVDSGAPQ